MLIKGKLPIGCILLSASGDGPGSGGVEGVCAFADADKQNRYKIINFFIVGVEVNRDIKFC